MQLVAHNLVREQLATAQSARNLGMPQQHMPCRRLLALVLVGLLMRRGGGQKLLALVLFFAIAMCAGACLFIINKIQRADPADLY